MEEIKKLLCVDVGSASLSGPTGLILIQEKARNFYEDGKKKHGEESGGTSLTLATAVSSVRVYSQSSQCLSIDCKRVAAHEFPEMLQEIIDEKQIHLSRFLMWVKQDCTRRECQIEVTSVRRQT